ncbi:MAG: AAA family ATPase [Dehalococcoidia bacterium]
MLIIGSGGSGKSTLARQISEITHLPVLHLDAYYWRTGWKPTPDSEWEERVQELAAGDRWIMDGNYSRTLHLRLPRVDTIVLLELPRALCLWRVVSRSIKYRSQTRPDMAEGCPERVSLEFLKWVWNYTHRSLPVTLQKIEEHGQHAAVHRLRSTRQIHNFIAGLHSAHSD